MTSPPFRRLSGKHSSRYVQSVYTVTKPAQPSPSDSPPGSGESHFPARERSEFLAELASGVVAVYCHAPARGRAHTRAHSVSGLRFLSRERFGVQPRAPRGQALSPHVSARAHRHARRPLWCLSRWWTPSLCYLRPGFPVRRSPDTVRFSRLEREASSDTKSALVTPSVPPPLPELAHVDTHTPSVCLLHARSFPNTRATKCAWEHHCAHPLRTIRDREQTSPRTRLLRAWVSRDQPRLGPTLSALSSPRVPVPCSDLS